jgi:4-hydroxybenzoate polyprenyltransferase
MKVHADFSALRRTKWYEYAIRFLFGGIITAITGLIAKKFGPQVGGLFLAFPAIFPATATLLEKHEKQKKERKGLNGTKRGRLVAGVDAAGAAMGAGGLIVFALIVWKLLPGRSGSMVLAGATLAWVIVAVSIWAAAEKLRQVQRKRFTRGSHS